MGIKTVLEKFASGTTMHGVPKVIISHSSTARCFWTIVCLAAGCMFCMQMSEVLKRYFSYPKKVSVVVVPTSVPFPSISLCNMRNLDGYWLNIINQLFIDNPNPLHNIDKSENRFIHEYMKLSAKYSALWSQEKYQLGHPLIFQEMFARTTYSANIDEDVISEAAVQLNQFVVNCFHGENSCNLKTEFTKFFDPYYFNCFTYTSHVSNEFVLSEGIENGWSSILYSGSGILKRNEDIRILPGLHESRSAVSANEGVRVVIHPPGSVPFPFTEGFDVPPGFSASFGIQPRKINRIGLPHGNCTAQNPFDGKSEEIYRLMSCQKLCLQKYIISTCGCKDKSLPCLPEDDVVPCRNFGEVPNKCLYEPTDACFEIFLGLYERIECIRFTKNIMTKNATLMKLCNCFPSCNEVSYDVSYSLSKWPASGYEGDAAFFDIFYIYNFRDQFANTPKQFNVSDQYFNDANRNNSMKDFTRLNVYIADSNVIITEEIEEYSSTQLVSDIGGQLGLWVGISIITLAEVFELICDILKTVFSRKKVKKRKSRKQKKHSRYQMRLASVQNGRYAPHSNHEWVLDSHNTRLNGDILYLRDEPH